MQRSIIAAWLATAIRAGPAPAALVKNRSIMSEESVEGSFSFDVTKRILGMLSESSPIKKTNLAIKTGLNYNVCLRYINMLQVLGWLEVEQGGKWEQISITDLGRQVNIRLLMTGSQKDAETASRARQPVRHEEPVQKSPIQTRHVMVVDDDPDVALTYESFLTSSGYKASVFSGAYDALRDFVSRSSYYDLVVLDIRMPDMNGLQLYQSLKAMNPACKVIFVSALDAAEELVSILPGVSQQDIIRKPVGKERFIRAVRAALS
jgi:CheY-like chemotaxis protein/predicted transcriptional regulator